ncbi:hypothetical protein Forpi1262_v014295 [Fusarium oxysporum f. sp. raphani]|uniref:Uncharacterized protein n=1 Tax=Fusarium oxysporum f. sp. raphani TaxID=96318 RepID=A0A8J5PUC6_FUSOX|nr:hypothetical protein Forpi1262_v014295 [Fusarium oxysporum f. sp. raphani]
MSSSEPNEPSQPYTPSKPDKPPELYKPLKGVSFYLTGRVKVKYEGKIKKNCGTIRDSCTSRTKYVVCSKAEYHSFRRRIAGGVGDKVELPDQDFKAIEKAYRDSEKGVLDTGCLDAISDNSHGWTPIDWADSYEKNEPETRFDVWIQQMQIHGVYRFSSLLDEAIGSNIEDDEEARSFDLDTTRIADTVKDDTDALALVNKWNEKYKARNTLIRDIRKVVGTLVQDETPVQDEGYESAT